MITKILHIFIITQMLFFHSTKSYAFQNYEKSCHKKIDDLKRIYSDSLSNCKRIYSDSLSNYKRIYTKETLKLRGQVQFCNGNFIIQTEDLKKTIIKLSQDTTRLRKAISHLKNGSFFLDSLKKEIKLHKQTSTNLTKMIVDQGDIILDLEKNLNSRKEQIKFYKKKLEDLITLWGEQIVSGHIRGHRGMLNSIVFFNSNSTLELNIDRSQLSKRIKTPRKYIPSDAKIKLKLIDPITNERITIRPKYPFTPKSKKVQFDLLIDYNDKYYHRLGKYKFEIYFNEILLYKSSFFLKKADVNSENSNFNKRPIPFPSSNL